MQRCVKLVLPARQTQTSSFPALLVFWKRTRGTRHKRAVSPYQSACQPENEQTKPGLSTVKKNGGQTGGAVCGQRANACITTWKQCVSKQRLTNNSFISRRHSADHKTALFKDMFGDQKICFGFTSCRYASFFLDDRLRCLSSVE